MYKIESKYYKTIKKLSSFIVLIYSMEITIALSYDDVIAATNTKGLWDVVCKLITCYVFTGYLAKYLALRLGLLQF